MKLNGILAVVVLAGSVFAMGQQAPSTAPPTFPRDQQTSPGITPDTPLPPGTNAEPGSQEQSPVTPKSNEDGSNTRRSRADFDLADQVQKALASDSILQKSSVSADIENGQLLLTGTVSSEVAKQRAEQIASKFAAEHKLKLVNEITIQS